MRVLADVAATPEQLTVILDTKPGSVVIRGAAGSGKTTTAVLRLKFLEAFWRRRLQDGHLEGPIRILVLTYNRTLRGYIEQLVQNQVGEDTELEIETFARWAVGVVGRPTNLDRAGLQMTSLAQRFPLPQAFVKDEAEYVLGRYLPQELDQYLTGDRRGRGTTPRMDRPLRERLLNEVVRPYCDWKASNGARDWNDLAIDLARAAPVRPYHVVIVDEAQDFSANQLRAVVNNLADEFSATYVLDAMQRIYPREFTWREAGIEVSGANSHLLSTNYRNTAEIAAFAAPLVAGLPQTDDGTLPDFESCRIHGAKPLLLEASFSRQMDFLMETIPKLPTEESIGILHARGGGWFSEVEKRLNRAGIPFVDMTRREEWPTGPERVGLSTMHSAKGLEFDHVFIVGLNQEVTPVGVEAEDDTTLGTYRRLLAMAIGRARKTVTISYKGGEASRLVEYFAVGTYGTLTR